MPEATVAIAEAASTTKASIESMLMEARLTEARLMQARPMERRTERMTDAAPADWASEAAAARPKSVSRRATRREAAGVTGRCHGPTATCVTLSLGWNQRQQHRERRNG
jgi:hypothetical protein